MCQTNGPLSIFRVGPHVFFFAPIPPLCPAQVLSAAPRSTRLVSCQLPSLGALHHPQSWPVTSFSRDLTGHRLWTMPEVAVWGPGTPRGIPSTLTMTEPFQLPLIPLVLLGGRVSLPPSHHLFFLGNTEQTPLPSHQQQWCLGFVSLLCIIC